MKNILLICLCMILITGCSSPKENYLKEIQKTDLISNMKNLKDLSEQAQEQFEKVLLNEEDEIPSYSAISEFRELLDSVTAEYEPIQKNYLELLELHQNLGDALIKYQEVAKQMEDAVLAVQDLNLQYKEVAANYNAIKEIIFSGNSTSIEYNEELNDFMSGHKQGLGLFDLSVSKELLMQSPLDIVKINTMVEDAIPALEDLKNLQTFTEIDQRVNELMVQMVQGIFIMVDYTIQNQEVIQATNQDGYFLEIEKQLEGANSSLDIWLTSIKESK